jgi:hypothetical protein
MFLALNKTKISTFMLSYKEIVATINLNIKSVFFQKINELDYI